MISFLKNKLKAKKGAADPLLGGDGAAGGGEGPRVHANERRSVSFSERDAVFVREAWPVGLDLFSVATMELDDQRKVF